MNNNVDWYDYNKLRSISNPSGECEVYIHAKWRKAFIIGFDIDDCIVFQTSERYEAYRGDQISDFRPLDWNKSQKKAVDPTPFINSGIDMEFGNIESWYVGKLVSINDEKTEQFEDDKNDRWEKCRPRMNHPMVLTQEQVDLIPDGLTFERQQITTGKLGDFEQKCIVVFDGLADGYCWPWEVSNA